MPETLPDVISPECECINSVMNENALTLLNTSILTAYGEYSYHPLSLNDARQIIRDHVMNGGTIRSAIGHQSTAELLTSLLDFPIAVNRMEFKQKANDVGLIFKLKRRPPEGKILNCEELESLGYEFGLLTRNA
jgi:hypothetical protein